MSQYSLIINKNMIRTAVIPPNNKANPSGNMLLDGNAMSKEMAKIISILFSRGLFINYNFKTKLEKKRKAVKEIERTG